MAGTFMNGSSPAEAPPNSIHPGHSLPHDDNDSCCDGVNLMVNQASKCFSSNDGETRHTDISNIACNAGDCSRKHRSIKDRGYKLTNPLAPGSCQDIRVPGPSEPPGEGDCCSSRNDMDDDGCGIAPITSSGCQSGCCGGQTDKSQTGVDSGTRNIQDDNDCLVPESTDHHYKKNYLAAPEKSHLELTLRSSCCEDKPLPCCDVSCLDRIALRECKDQKSAAQTGEASEGIPEFDASSSCHQSKDGVPCDQHTNTVREKYAATLEALGCICRSLLALGQESCCGPQRASFGKKRRSTRSLRSTPRASIDSCCATGAHTNTFTTGMRTRSEKGGRNVNLKDKADACIKGCCEEAKVPSTTDSCRNIHCTDQEPSGSIAKSKGTFTDVAHTADLEKGSSGKKHIILSISGMTCTGCETKLQRALGTIGSVKNLKTSLILARAEFDLDAGAETPAEVVKHLERTTEFKCERVMDQVSRLDIVPTGDVSSFVQQKWPYGVTEIKIVNKKTVSIAFDAKIVGARDLVEKGWGTPLNLAARRADPTLEAGSKHVRHLGYMTLLSIILTIPVLVFAWAPFSKRKIAYDSASLALATIVQLVIAGPFYPKALKSLIFSRMIEMDLLIVLSTSAAYIFSVVSFGHLVAGKPLSTGEFFETSTLLVTLIMVGRYVGALARQKAVETISIRSLQPSTATLIDQAGDEKNEVDARLLQYGDVFQIAPDSRVPTDGTVISGSSEVDESMLTGELTPVEKHAKSSVIAGSINRSGTLIVRLTRLPSDNTISTIAGMVDEAKLSKPNTQRIADRVAAYFIPVVLAATIITFVIWVAVGVAVRRQSGVEASIQAVTYAITVLIVSCPCAIGLAVPMVIVIASGVAAKRGVLFKSADSIELAYRISHVVFDKTGTLTQGKLSVAVEELLGTDTSTSMSLLLGLVWSSKHPVAAAVSAHLEKQGVLASAITDQKTLTGKGMEGNAPGLVLRAGNCRWLNLSSHPYVQPILSQGYTVFCFTINNSLAVVFGLHDSLRPDALSTIMKLHQRGISVHIVSGDEDGAVRSVATQLSIPGINVRSRCSPADKKAYIHDLLASPGLHNPAEESKKPIIIFCGDGTNDAVALAQATIGVHVNEGTDVAKSAADVVLMRPSLTGILTIIDVSKKSVDRIKFNFIWSFVYNLSAILLGAGAFVNVRIPPEFAGLGELVSTLPVIAAAVLLRWSKV